MKKAFEEYLKTSEELAEKYMASDVISKKRPAHQLTKYLSSKTGHITESGLNRVRQSWMDHDTGIITAFRDKEDCGKSDTIPKSEKKNRNHELKIILTGMGYGVTNVKGSWFENGDEEKGEASWFVVDYKDKGGLKKALTKLGVRYEQDAVIYAEKGGDFSLISTNKCPKAEPGEGRIGVEVKIGKPKFGKTGIYGFSRVSGRSFVFEGFKLSKLTDHGVNEWRSIRAVTDRFLGIESIFNIGKRYE
jgi:hypothetical protein